MIRCIIWAISESALAINAESFDNPARDHLPSQRSYLSVLRTGCVTIKNYTFFHDFYYNEPLDTNYTV